MGRSIGIGHRASRRVLLQAALAALASVCSGAPPHVRPGEIYSVFWDAVPTPAVLSHLTIRFSISLHQTSLLLQPLAEI